MGPLEIHREYTKIMGAINKKLRSIHFTIQTLHKDKETLHKNKETLQITNENLQTITQEQSDANFDNSAIITISNKKLKHSY
jgi:hypothetical protein